MASATATATMAAAGFDKRPSATSSLQTPGSGTFPSEMLSPMVNSPAFMRREDALKTPITPPSAYLDFLKNMSPAMLSPAPTGTSTRFSFHEKAHDRSFDKASDPASDTSRARTSITPPTSEPSLSRNTSYDSTRSNVSDLSVTTTDSTTSNKRSKPESPRIIIPPSSHFAKPAPKSARTPRRLHIPQSPYSPALGSAQTAPSPYSMSSNPLSAAPWSASFSPHEPHADANGQSGKVSVRHVVTRTVTYCRTPLDPAPKGKRRKLEETRAKDLSSPPPPSHSRPVPPIKQEKIEEVSEKSDDSASETDATTSTTTT